MSQGEGDDDHDDDVSVPSPERAMSSVTVADLPSGLRNHPRGGRTAEEGDLGDDPLSPALSAYSAAFSTQDLTLFDPPSSLAANLSGYGDSVLPSGAGDQSYLRSYYGA
eukprot:TRINITY_DN7071_c0_g1_i1.p3 TRINITY_DN7071_c0_g1~~TRINITY_DN7071_c0_g1_i1.p3  ORF type:complete len:109 (-),score=31.34 TRINITY_DN7071_c0_g1_i1:395-721(-)